MITVYGSEDGVLNRSRLEEGIKYMPEDHVEFEIRGGNHARFGDYGEQKGDGASAIPAAEQQDQTVELILKNAMRE